MGESPQRIRGQLELTTPNVCNSMLAICDNAGGLA